MISNILKRIHILVNSQKSSVADPEPKLKEPGLKFKCLPEPDPKMKNWRSSSFLFIKEIFRIRNTAANFLKDSFWKFGSWIKCCVSGMFIRIPASRVSDPHWFNADPDTDPDPVFFLIADPDSGSRIRIQGWMTQSWKKFIAGTLIYIFFIKNCNLLILRPP